MILSMRLVANNLLLLLDVPPTSRLIFVNVP